MPKRILQGLVVSDKGAKTVVVKVERTYLHPLLKKTVRRSKRYHAHDETNAITEGTQVRIIECPPRSKLKRWEVFTGEAQVGNAKPVGKGKVEAPADTDATAKPKDDAPKADA